MYCQPEDSANILILSTFDVFLDALNRGVGYTAVELDGDESALMFK